MTYESKFRVKMPADISLPETRKTPSKTVFDGVAIPDNCGSFLKAGFSHLDPQPQAEVERQAGVADRGYVLVAGEVFGLSVDRHARKELVAAAEVDLGETVVEVAVGKQQRVVLVEVGVAEKGRVVAAAGEGHGGGHRPALAGIAGVDEAGVGRAAERPRALERGIDADGNAGIGGRVAAEERRVVAGKGALHHRIERGIAAL